MDMPQYEQFEVWTVWIWIAR